MEAFRKLIKGWLGKVLLVIFIVPFAFFGIEGLFNSAGRDDTAIKVNGESISNAEIARVTEARRQQLAQQMRVSDPSVISDEVIRPMVEKSLIQKTLINQMIDESGLYVPRKEVGAYVQNMPQLRGDDGKFSQDRFRMLLAQLGYSSERFVSEVEQGMLFEQLRAALENAAIVTPDEIRRLVILNKQLRDIATLQISTTSFEDQVEVSDEEIEAYYNEHENLFQTDEQVKLEYVEIKDTDMNVEEPTEEEIQQEFDDELAQAKAKERRRAQHILVEINDDRDEEAALARINEVKSKLESGASFEELAKEYSDDIATAKLGGDLGYAGKGIYDEAFEKALFALPEGGVSDIVKTEFGYHIIKLTGIEKEELPKLTEQKKQEIINKLKSQRAKDELIAAMDELNRISFESGDLSEVADTFHVKVQQTDWMAKNSREGIFSHPEVVSAAFSEPVLQDRENSEAIEVDDSTLILVRVTDYKPAQRRPLQEVTNEIKQRLVKEKAKALAQAKADEIIEKLKQGVSSADIETEYGLSWKVSEKVSRQANDLDRNVVQEAFAMPRPDDTHISVKRVQAMNGDQFVLMVRNVYDGEYTLSDAEQKQLAEALSQRYGAMEFNGFVELLEQAAEIERKN